MEKVLYPSNVPIFPEDLTASETYRETETLRRWNNVVGQPGVIAKNIDDDVLMLTTGGTTGQTVVSAGAAYMPNGEYVTCPGGTISSLVPGSLSAVTYVVLKRVVSTSGNRTNDITTGNSATRSTNSTGASTVLGLASATGNNVVILGKITAIDVGNNVTLDTGHQSGRRVMRLSNASYPVAPTGLAVETGLMSTGMTVSGYTGASGRSSDGYIKVTWQKSTHVDGIWAYRVRLFVLDNDDNIVTGQTQEQLVTVGGNDGPAWTGCTFMNLTTGMKVIPEVSAISDGAHQVLGTGATGTSTVVGQVGQVVMPVITYEAKSYGIEVSWSMTNGTATAITMYEVFAGSSDGITGATTDYTDLYWRGYAGKCRILADEGDQLRVKVRGVDGGGQVTSSYRTLVVDYTGIAAPPVPKNIKVYTGSARNTLREGANNLVAKNFREKLSARISNQPNKPFVEAQWGWEGRQGAWANPTSTTKQFNLPSTVRLVDAEAAVYDLTNWYLVFESYSDEKYYHKISGNTSSIITTYPVGGYSYGADHTGKFWITPNADKYDVSIALVDAGIAAVSSVTGGGASGTFTPMTNPTTQRAIKYDGLVNRAESPTAMEYRFPNPVLGAAYSVKVRSVSAQGKKSGYSEERMVIAGASDNPLVMPIVRFKVIGTRVSLQWNSLQDAIGYELSYTVDGSEPDFLDTGTIAFVYGNKTDISVQAGDTLKVKIRAVDQNGQVSSNIREIETSIGIPSGYYSLSPYNLNINFTTSTSTTTDYQIDFPFAFGARYLTVIITDSGSLATGETIDYKLHPVDNPNAEDHILLTWQGNQVNKVVKQNGDLAVRADGSMTLRIDSSDATPGKTVQGQVTVWYEQLDITPPVSPGGGTAPGPRSAADTRSIESFSGGSGGSLGSSDTV